MGKDGKITREEALNYHEHKQPGKLSILPTKSLLTQRDLSLAYSPGVAYPCLEIHENPDLAYNYTSKANLIAVVSNGTAVLGLGNLGALASKPVMEGKSVLFKKFADIDSIDIEVDTENVDEFINCVKYLAPSWGGINLEDIKAPDCFIIEQKLREMLDIPVFHDDQHGTAIIALAALINAAHLTKRKFNTMKIVSTGAGAASIACVELLKKLGILDKNIILVDSQGVVYKGREKGMNPWKLKHAIDTPLRTLEEAMVGADVLIGLSVKGLVSKEMVKSMAKNPIIFALANPDPEISPEEVKEVRDDAIIATGRSDYPNQVNNVMGFPYIFRGALDVRAKNINDEMKIAAAHALADLAREPVPDEVSSAYSGRSLSFGPEYLIPVPFDSRLIYAVPTAVAKAAMESKVARKSINIDTYKKDLISRLNPTASMMNTLLDQAIIQDKRVIFADGEEAAVIKAAISMRNNGYGKPILVGRSEKIIDTVRKFSEHEKLQGIEIANAKISKNVDKYVEYLYSQSNRKGLLHRDCIRLVKGDRNIFASCMLQCGDGEALVAGYTRSYKSTLTDIFKILQPKQGHDVFGLSIMMASGKTLFLADSAVHINPTAEQFVNMAIQTAQKVKSFGEEPRVAFLSFANFGNAKLYERTDSLRKAIEILDNTKNIDFEYEGELTADVALDYDIMRKIYPFSRLSKAANILIMPSLHTAHISSKLLKEVGGGAVIGPILLGFEKSVQIVRMEASVEELVNMAAIALANS